MQPPILSVASKYHQYQGEEHEAKRIAETRASKRKALEELVKITDRPLSVDEWFKMARDTVGADGLLYGTAPTASILESMRQTQNANAEETRKKTAYDDLTRSLDVDTKVESRVRELVRSGKRDPLDVYGSLRDQWGEDVAKKFEGRIGGFVNQVDMEDEANGYKFGSVYQSEDDAKTVRQKQPGRSEAYYRGFETAVTANIAANDAKIAEIGNRVASSGLPVDSPEVRTWIEGQLPYAIRKDPKSAADAVDRASRYAAGGARLAQAAQQVDRDKTVHQAATQMAIADPVRRAELWSREQERIRTEIKDVERRLADQAKGHIDAIDSAFSGASKIKNPQLQGMVQQARSTLGAYDVPAAIQAEISAAVAGKDEEALSAALSKAMTMSTPLSEVRDARLRVARVESGSIPSPNEAFVELSPTAWELGSMRQRGQVVRQHMGAGPLGTKAAQAELDGAVDTVRKEILSNREILKKAGTLNIDPQTLAAFERDLAYKLLLQLEIGSSAMSAIGMLDKVLPPAIDIKAGRVTPESIYSSAAAPMLGSVQPAPPVGAGTAPPRAAAPGGFYAGTNPGVSLRSQPGDSDHSTLLNEELQKTFARARAAQARGDMGGLERAINDISQIRAEMAKNRVSELPPR